MSKKKNRKKNKKKDRIVLSSKDKQFLLEQMDRTIELDRNLETLPDSILKHHEEIFKPFDIKALGNLAVKKAKVEFKFIKKHHGSSDKIKSAYCTFVFGQTIAYYEDLFEENNENPIETLKRTHDHISDSEFERGSVSVRNVCANLGIYVANRVRRDFFKNSFNFNTSGSEAWKHHARFQIDTRLSDTDYHIESIGRAQKDSDYEVGQRMQPENSRQIEKLFKEQDLFSEAADYLLEKAPALYESVKERYGDTEEIRYLFSMQMGYVYAHIADPMLDIAKEEYGLIFLTDGPPPCMVLGLYVSDLFMDRFFTE